MKNKSDDIIFQSAIHDYRILAEHGFYSLSQSLKYALTADEIIAILQAVCEFLIACHRSKLL